MKFDVVTIFPEFFRGPFAYGVVGQAVKSGLLGIEVHDLRNWAFDKHRMVDDRPFGGGEGMLLKPEPVFSAVEAILPERGPRTRVVRVSASGRKYDQGVAREWAANLDRLVLICGRYEGFDERIRAHVDEEISLGDFVMTGGEVAAMAVIEATVRLLPGVLGNESSATEESHAEATGGMLEYPQYTRPVEFRGATVPEILSSGHHAQIEAWRKAQSLERTRARRPDLVRPEPEPIPKARRAPRPRPTE